MCECEREQKFQFHLFASVFSLERIKPLLCWSHHWVISQRQALCYWVYMNGTWIAKAQTDTWHKTKDELLHSSSRAELWCSGYRHGCAFTICTSKAQQEQMNKRQTVFDSKKKIAKFIFDFLFFSVCSRFGAQF